MPHPYTGLVDEVAAAVPHGHQLTRVHRLGGHTVRVRVHRDHYSRNSSATAAVLTPDLTWTELCTDPPSRWHDNTAPVASVDPDLAAVADALLHRAAAVLGHETAATAYALAL